VIHKLEIAQTFFHKNMQKEIENFLYLQCCLFFGNLKKNFLLLTKWILSSV
jgi:hypothetical protein